MCGICGILGAGPDDGELLAGMADTLRHRGPDHTGLLTEPPVALAMTRLSIIDLSGGNQPMHSADGQVSMVFNGEIYNFRELRAEIEPHIPFRTRSDTEVILNGYCLWGEEVFRRLNGIFAVALWDRRRGRVLLARDPMGVKPYYLLQDGPRLLFSSEVKTFTFLGLANRADPAGVAQFLAADYVFHPDTAIAGVRQLPPGTLLRVDPASGRSESLRFRTPGDGAPDDLPADAAGQKRVLKRVLDEAVVRQTVADVPYGLLLSAGVDSMTVLALLHHHGLTDNLRTYTVYYPDNASFSEHTPVARLAERWGFRNELVPLDAQGLRAHWPQVCATFDNLDLLPTAVALQVVCGVAGRERRVLLAGNGGDELLFGYPTYRASQWVRRTRALAPLVRTLLPPLARRLPVSDDYLTTGEKIQRFAQGYHRNPELAHLQWRHVFTVAELGALLRDDYRVASAEALYARQLEHFAEGRARGFDGTLLDGWVDMRTWMVDSGLMMWDKAGMAGSTEIRVPILDLEFVDHVLALPEDVRTGGRPGTKALLKEIVAEEVPADILALPKHGFQAPIATWLRGDLHDMFRELASALPETVFDHGVIDRLWREFDAGQGGHALKLWTLGALSGWSEAHHVTW